MTTYGKPTKLITVQHSTSDSSVWVWTPEYHWVFSFPEKWKSFFGMKSFLATLLLFTWAAGHWSVTTCYHQALKIWLIPQLFTNVGQEGDGGGQKPLGMKLPVLFRRSCFCRAGLLQHKCQKEGMGPQCISTCRANWPLLSPHHNRLFVLVQKCLVII